LLERQKGGIGAQSNEQKAEAERLPGRGDCRIVAPARRGRGRVGSADQAL